ncbi:hypothetical protein BN133_1045 [Cronobacter dublinensis 582]|nr:hypothetical protein BN133_1045 [Cronobacter dublinensis 582]
MRQVIFAAPGHRQQFIIERAAFGRQRHAALFNFAKARGMRAGAVAAKADRLFKRFKAGLAQQNGKFAARRPFDNGLRFNAIFRHQRLHAIDIQRARRQVVDVTAAKAHHIGNQPVLVMQRLIGGGVHRRMAVPAERLQRLAHKLLRLRGIKPALLVVDIQQFIAAMGKDIATRKHRRRALAQLFVLNKFKAQQRGENAKRITRQRHVIHRAKRRGVDRHARLREIIIADRLHPHNGENTSQRRQLFGGADANGPVALDVKPRQFIGVGELLMQLRVAFQYRQVNVGHQFQQRTVLRHLVLVHGRHGLRKMFPNLICRDAVRHGVVPPVNIAEIVENGGSFSGEEFTICDPKRNKGSGAARKAKSAIKQQTTAQRLPPPCAVWLTSGHTRLWISLLRAG